MTDTPANKVGTRQDSATIVDLFDKLWNVRVTTSDPEGAAPVTTGGRRLQRSQPMHTTAKPAS